jgi:hypothetical protein
MSINQPPFGGFFRTKSLQRQPPQPSTASAINDIQIPFNRVPHPKGAFPSIDKDAGEHYSTPTVQKV